MPIEINKECAAQPVAVLPGPGNGLGSISFKNYENKSLLCRRLSEKCQEIVESGVCITDCDH